MILRDLLENIQTAWGSLLANKLRSILTMLGVIIGVAAVIALLAIGEGVQASINAEMTSAGTNLLNISPSNGSDLTYKDAEAIADPDNVPGASVVSPEYSTSTSVIFGSEEVRISVNGITPAYQETNDDIQVAQGQFIETQDVDKRASVAVLGYQTAIDLFGGFDPIGQKIKVVRPDDAEGGRVSLTVVGVLEEQGSSGFSNPDEAIYVPITTAQMKIFDGRNAKGETLVTSVTIIAASEEQVDATQSQVESLLTERHDLDTDDDTDFRVFNQADMLDMASSVTDTLKVFLGAIAGISLLVGGIGIMNIMLVSVTERTREIGLLKAVGAQKSDILTQFMLEAVLLSVIGGLIGVVLGITLAELVALSGMMEAVVTFSSILLSMGFSLATGLFFGIYPANQAASLNPIEALRYE